MTQSETPSSLDSPGNPDLRDLIIVGSGPSGYTAAIYAARAALAPLVLTGSVTAGGALMNTTEVENFPGFRDGIMGPALMDEMHAQAERFGAELVPDDAVALDLTGPVKTVTDGEGNVHRAKAVILATGSGYRRLGLDGEDRLSGRGVSWCATCDGFFFRGHDIAVVGGGDSAAEEATFLSRFASKVYLVVRGTALRASKVMAERVYADPKIEVLYETRVVSLNGAESLESVTLAGDGVATRTGVGQVDLSVAGLFIAIGHDPRSELLEGQVHLDAGGYVLVNGTGNGEGAQTATNIEGVFACGDLVDHTYRQAITAAGTGCAAALDAERYLAGLGE